MGVGGEGAQGGSVNWKNTHGARYEVQWFHMFVYNLHLPRNPDFLNTYLFYSILFYDKKIRGVFPPGKDVAHPSSLSYPLTRLSPRIPFYLRFSVFGLL